MSETKRHLGCSYTLEDTGSALTSQDIRATQRFYNRISGVYDALADRDEHRAREMGLQLLNLGAGERALEIGFGTGRAIVPMAHAVGKTGRVLGIEIAEGMAQVAKRRVATAELSGTVEFVVAAVPPIPAADRTFDAAFMAFSLELFPDDTIPVVLHEVRRVLTANGRLIVVAMDEGTEEQKARVAERAYRWLHHHFPHIVDCRPIDVAGELTRAGFVIAQEDRLEIWGLTVKVCLAVPASNPDGVRGAKPLG
ncbi:MAG: methyltransferase domain-containing protein [Vicinamibacterales bacterium]